MSAVHRAQNKPTLVRSDRLHLGSEPPSTELRIKAQPFSQTAHSISDHLCLLLREHVYPLSMPEGP